MLLNIENHHLSNHCRRHLDIVYKEEEEKREKRKKRRRKNKRRREMSAKKEHTNSKH